MPLVARTFAEVLSEAWPGSSWSIVGDDLATLRWDGPGDRPTDEAIEAASEAAWLALAKKRAAVAVDEQAETERLLYITPGAGQAMVYQEKAREARLFQDIGGTGYPLLTASVGVEINPQTGLPVVDLAEAAARVLAISAQWSVVAADIEGRRLGAKADIATAGTIEAVEEAVAVHGWTVP